MFEREPAQYLISYPLQCVAIYTFNTRLGLETGSFWIVNFFDPLFTSINAAVFILLSTIMFNIVASAPPRG